MNKILLALTITIATITLSSAFRSNPEESIEIFTNKATNYNNETFELRTTGEGVVDPFYKPKEGARGLDGSKGEDGIDGTRGLPGERGF